MSNELIILPCHSIWKGGSTLGKLRDEWFLASFQMEGEDHLCFREHIETSFKLLKEKPTSILVVSGGQTKAEAGRVSESESYVKLLQSMFPDDQKDFLRVVAEEYARDSFENVLLLICRFQEISGTYPSHITIVGFEFKKERFVACHLERALSFPENRVTYVGNHPSPKDKISRYTYYENLASCERRYALEPFNEDLYGLRSPLRTKRLQRDPYQRQHNYRKSNPELAKVLDCIENSRHCKSDTVMRGAFKFNWGF